MNLTKEFISTARMPDTTREIFNSIDRLITHNETQGLKPSTITLHPSQSRPVAAWLRKEKINMVGIQYRGYPLQTWKPDSPEKKT